MNTHENTRTTATAHHSYHTCSLTHTHCVVYLALLSVNVNVEHFVQELHQKLAWVVELVLLLTIVLVSKSARVENSPDAFHKCVDDSKHTDRKQTKTACGAHTTHTRLGTQHCTYTQQPSKRDLIL